MNQILLVNKVMISETYRMLKFRLDNYKIN